MRTQPAVEKVREPGEEENSASELARAHEIRSGARCNRSTHQLLSKVSTNAITAEENLEEYLENCKIGHTRHQSGNLEENCQKEKEIEAVSGG